MSLEEPPIHARAEHEAERRFRRRAACRDPERGLTILADLDRRSRGA